MLHGMCLHGCRVCLSLCLRLGLLEDRHVCLGLLEALQLLQLL